MEKNTREVVLSILLDIEKNHTFSNTALGTALRANQFMSKQDRAYITRMVEGVTEKRMRLDYIVNQFSKTKINKCKPLIRCVLRMGTYEIFYMDSVQDHTACNLHRPIPRNRLRDDSDGGISLVGHAADVLSS